MPGNPLVRFDEGRVGRTVCRPLSYSTLNFACLAARTRGTMLAVFESRSTLPDQFNRVCNTTN
jgi:hypothetical protein